MSRETEKIFKEFHKYMEEHSDENRSEEDLERLTKEFMMHYNANSENAAKVAPETSDDYLELAYDADNVVDVLKYLKKALALDPYNFDAEAMLIDMKAKTGTELVQKYAKAVQKATNHMKEEGYFDDEYMGEFWGVLETRSYMRLRTTFLEALIQCGQIGQAQEECKELLRLCEGDNLGMRYRLMHIYAYFEDEEAALALHKRFGSYNETEMLLPLSILYYKKGNYNKASRYLRNLRSANKDLKRFLQMIMRGTLDEFERFKVEGGYRPGTIEELVMEFRDNLFLFTTTDEYMEWAMRQINK